MSPPRGRTYLAGISRASPRSREFTCAKDQRPQPPRSDRRGVHLHDAADNGASEPTGQITTRSKRQPSRGKIKNDLSDCFEDRSS